MTHERNVLMWLIRCLDPHFWGWVRLAIYCIAVFVVMCWLLACKSPTTPDRPLTPNEILAIEYAQCHVKYHELPFEVKIQFVDEIRHDGAKAWGDIMSRSITLVRPWLERWAPVDIEMVVGHEICHVKGIFDCDAATRCAQDAYLNAGCH